MTRFNQNTAVTLFASLAAACLIACTSASPASAGPINGIGINFVGSSGTGGTLGTNDSAGVMPQTHWNNVTGNTPTGISLHNQTGVASGASLTVTNNGGIYTAASTTVPGDEALNSGFIFGTSTATVSGVPYAKYDVFVYELNDASGRQETTTLNGTTSYYGVSTTPTNAGLVDNNPATAYTYVQATSQTAGTFTPNANFVEFQNVTGASFSITNSAPGNGYLNGIQIVQATPEPSSFVLLGLAGAGLFVAARRRRRA